MGMLLGPPSELASLISVCVPRAQGANDELLATTASTWTMTATAMVRRIEKAHTCSNISSDH